MTTVSHHRRTFIRLPRAQEPPRSNENRETAPDQASVVHRRCVDRQSVWEAVDHEPDHHVYACDSVEDEADGAFQMEWTVDLDVLPPGEEIGQNGGDVGRRRHADKGADKGVERCETTDVDGAEDGN